MQMPPGVPVATVAINGAKNAAVLAVQILATSDGALENSLIEYKKKLADAVEEKARNLGK
ncbi:MAG: Phosphoribosylaminoimidazole carboxylase, catalytic subunit [uncultured bacterium]|nr:MAG: Phosphoribosylaminoimidazole carboxylase, catalytic subunit [uncultured bacterium]